MSWNEIIESDPRGRAIVYRFFVPGEPISWARAGRNGGRTFTPKRVRDREAEVATEFADAYPAVEPDAESRFTVCITFYAGTKRRSDVDNLGKLVLDALNKRLWQDDCQIDSLTLLRRPLLGDDVAGTWIEVWVD